MKKIIAVLSVIFSYIATCAQNNLVERPKLVVGIVVDQMRWDYLYRYYNRYTADGGFKRLLLQGYSCENTLIPYLPTYTACGHSCIYTGSVPAIHGITGNTWNDNITGKVVYCTQDDSVNTVGSNSVGGKMSPRNMLATSICDELRLATNFKSKVLGFAIKDRGSILPAGHSANAAYWYDGTTGDWITSSYYMSSLPQWMEDFNKKKLADTYYAQNWNTLYPVNTYTQSTTEDKQYLAKPFGLRFPYDLKKFVGKNYSSIAAAPYGNSFTLEAAKAGLTAENLGKDSVTDFLAVSLSSTDYVGHTFGPNSIEAEDTYLRLDKDLGEFFNFLDEKVGKDQYLVFLSADHGAAHAVDFLKENKIPAGANNEETLLHDLNIMLKSKSGKDSVITEITNYQVFLNHSLIEQSKLDENVISKWIVDFLVMRPGISMAVNLHNITGAPLSPIIKDMIVNGYYPKRSGDIQFVLQPQWLEGLTGKGTTHGSWNPYDAHIPLVWYGWHIKNGKTNRQTSMADIAPTVAAMLHIQMPSGNIGHVIEEVTK